METDKVVNAPERESGDLARNVSAGCSLGLEIKISKQLKERGRRAMNEFQKQLILKDGKCMAELSMPERDGIGQPLPPTKVSIEDFERNVSTTKKGKGDE